MEIEPLKLECQHFINCCKTGKKARSDGENGFVVVSILEALVVSLPALGPLVAGIVATISEFLLSVTVLLGQISTFLNSIIQVFNDLEVIYTFIMAIINLG